MGTPFVSPLELNYNELQQARMQLLASDPSAPSTPNGIFYFSTSLGRMRVHDGTAFRSVATLSDSISSFGVPTSNLDMNGYRITGLGTPAVASDAATKGYVDAAISGLDWRESVEYATTHALDPAGGTADGPTITTWFGGIPAHGSRILLIGSGPSVNNGIYKINISGSGPYTWSLTRADDVLDSGVAVYVSDGNLAGSCWVLTTEDPITVGTTPLTFSQFAGVGAVEGVNIGTGGQDIYAGLSGSDLQFRRVNASNTSGTALTVSTVNNTVTFNLNPANLGLTTSNVSEGSNLYFTNARAIGSTLTGFALPGSYTAVSASDTILQAIQKLAAAAQTSRIYAANVGNGSATTITVTHNLGTRDVVVEVYENSGNYRTVAVEVRRPSTNEIALVFASAPASNAYRVVIRG